MSTFRYLFSTTLCSLLFCVGAFAQKLDIIPKHPQQDDRVQLIYNASGGPLDGEQFQTTVYLLEPFSEPIAVDVDMVRDGKVYKGEFMTDQRTTAALVSFNAVESQLQDNNDDSGYVLRMHKRDAPVKGSAVALGELFIGNYGRSTGLPRTPVAAQEYFAEEMRLQKKIHKDPRFIALQAKVSAAMDDADAQEDVKARLVKRISSGKWTEENAKQFAIAATALQDDELLAQIKAKAIAEHPRGLFAAQALIDSFYQVKDGEQKAHMFKDIVKMTRDQEDLRQSTSIIARRLALAAAQDEDRSEFERYMRYITDPGMKASMYNSIAWDFSGGSIDAEGKDMKYGQKISKESMELVADEMESLAHKPASMSSKRYRDQMSYSHAMYSDTYALLAYKNGDPKEAAKYQAIAVEKSDYSDAVMNRRHAIYLDDAGHADDALDFLKARIANGQADAAMKNHFKELHQSQWSAEKAADMYVELLEQEAKRKKRQEIIDNLSSGNIVEMTLTDMDGNEVQTADLKGKITILDFWATWCGPCIQSFPAMQTAVDELSSDDVQFYFVNTWENVEDKTAHVADFLKKGQYRFDVLMDSESKVVQDYGVEGIPTKFVLDQEGRIRFTSVGFNGNNDELVEEIRTVIELLSAQKS